MLVLLAARSAADRGRHDSPPALRECSAGVCGKQDIRLSFLLTSRSSAAHYAASFAEIVVRIDRQKLSCVCVLAVTMGTRGRFPALEANAAFA